MPPSSPQDLSDLQLRLMEVLWDRGEATVADVQAALSETHPLATTTVATLMSRLHRRGVIRRRRTEGRHYLYAAELPRERVRRSMVSRLMERLFAGDASALVAHLVEEGALDTDELAALRRRIEAQEQDGARDAD